MNPSDLARRLAALPTLGDLPSRETEWLAAQGEYRDVQTGDVIAWKGERIEHLWILLSGHIAVYRETPTGRTKVMSWGPGGVTGRLPYSRMTLASTDIVLEERMEAIALHEKRFPELVAQCPTFTEHTVHLMVDRVRSFKATELQAEKLVSLGRLSAGLAHELNNPASATARGAAILREGLGEQEGAARELFASGLSPDVLEVLDRTRARCIEGAPAGVPSPLELADRETRIEDWLEEHGCDPFHAGALAESGAELDALQELAAALPEEALCAAVRWLAASCSTHAVATQIEGAARRIHDLVAAVKRFTYMDNLTASDTIDVGEGLRDTVTVLGSKIRSRGATVDLDLAEDLPPARARGSELNQVWMNLVDNALDAVADSGRIEMSARRQGDRVVVRVVDDGPGIPDDVLPRIFDPFFTTKSTGEGTGLGLDIARRIVTQNGGTLEVESRPGRTEFRVSLAAEPGGRENFP